VIFADLWVILGDFCKKRGVFDHFLKITFFCQSVNLPDSDNVGMVNLSSGSLRTKRTAKTLWTRGTPARKIALLCALMP
jgi:hypothetical protein